ncbi:MAG: hypothetical protein AAF298_16795, partial [Cyanobacteria bacterium P01_A01_bin.40]
ERLTRSRPGETKDDVLDREFYARIDLMVQRSELTEKRLYIQSTYPWVRIKSICSCQWKLMKSNDPQIRKTIKTTVFPPLARINPTFGDIIRAVKSDDFFGILEVDIHVPKDLEERYDVFPPFFCHQDITMEMLSPDMQKLGSNLGKKTGKRLVSTLEARNFVVISPLLKFYLERGFVVTKLHQAIRFTPRLSFEKFGQEIHKLRCDAVSDPKLAITAETIKLAGNSLYGKTIERKDRHTSVRYLKTEDLGKKIRDRKFKNYELLLGENHAEVEEYLGRMVDNTPKLMGVFILGYAKLVMLRFAYMLFDFVDDRDWSPVLMDTDSLCMELSVPNGDLDAIIRPEKREEWQQVRHNFLPCSPDVYEQKRHGIFKIEFSATRLVALSAKSYSLSFDDGDGEVRSKIAAKGISKRHNELSYEDYKTVLQEQKDLIGENRGFKRTADGAMFQYRQKKVALTSFYGKRWVCKDKINTRTLRFPAPDSLDTP